MSNSTAAPRWQPAGDATSQNFDSYIAGELRCIVLRLKLMVNELNFIGVALTKNVITASDALEELHALGVLDHIGRREDIAA